MEAGKKYEVSVSYTEDPRRRLLDRIKYDLIRYEIKTSVKDDLYEALCKAEPDEMPGIIAAADIPKRYRKRLAESLGL